MVTPVLFIGFYVRVYFLQASTVVFSGAYSTHIVNLKYNIDWCIFSYPNNTQTTVSEQCNDRCSGPHDSMMLALTDHLLITDTTLQYNYCDDGNRAFPNHVADCIACVQSVPASQALVNYLTVLGDACDQKPKINGSTPVRLKQDLFQGVTATASSTASVSSESGPTSTVVQNNTFDTHSSLLRLGLGLGLGLGITFLLFTVGALWFIVRERKRHRNLKQSAITQSDDDLKDLDFRAPAISAHPYVELDAPPVEMSAGQPLRHEKDTDIRASTTPAKHGGKGRTRRPQR